MWSAVRDYFDAHFVRFIPLHLILGNIPSLRVFMRRSIMPQVAVIRNFPLFWGASGTAYQYEVQIVLTKSNGSTAGSQH